MPPHLLPQWCSNSDRSLFVRSKIWSDHKLARRALCRTHCQAQPACGTEAAAGSSQQTLPRRALLLGSAVAGALSALPAQVCCAAKRRVPTASVCSSALAHPPSSRTFCRMPQRRPPFPLQASRLPEAVDKGWEAIGGGPADLVFPEEFLGVWEVTSVLQRVDLPLGEDVVPDMAVSQRGLAGGCNTLLVLPAIPLCLANALSRYIPGTGR